MGSKARSGNSSDRVDTCRRGASFKYELHRYCRTAEDLSDMFGIEIVVIDDKTDIAEFKKELRYNEYTTN